jgi:VCBS repeat-containing protein
MLNPSSGARQAAVANAAVLNPIAVLLNNQTPTMSPTQTGQSQTGVVSGDLSGLDPDSSALSYTVVSTPAHGSVALDATGHYSYTPDPTLLHAGVTDSFRVTVSDAGAGIHIHGLVGLINLLTFGLIGASGHTSTSTVNVIVRSLNEAPVTSVSVGAPNEMTGVVLGTVNAVDAEGDPLTFTGSTTTTKGSVVVASGGSFTYTPTAAARHAASSLSATAVQTTDTFTVTVNDAHGGVVAVPVTVAISPTNVTPNASSVVGAPNNSTGIVAGTAIGVDGDGDPLTYTGSTTTTKGAVVVAADGGFTYTPTAVARHAAAAPNATSADKADAFTITVSDGHGGVVALPVAVSVAPGNADPVASPTAGAPNASTGVVVGNVNAVDADGDPLSYSGSTTTANGAVIVGTNGSFTYTPSATARHNAAASTATITQTTDTFTVTVTDGYGATVAVPVTVTVGPANVAPVGVPSVGTPNASTGVVAGNVIASDADGDPLTYGGSATTAKGTVVVTVGGGFTYTPTAAARHAASSLTAIPADQTDSFSLTVSDGHGGIAAVPVSVTIAPANAAPIAVPNAGIPDATTGVVAGAILGADVDGDALSYTGSTTTAKGAIVVAANGNFTYTPTALARHAAASPTATAAQTTDTVTVTVTDGHGGSIDVPVNVVISPAAVNFTFVYSTGSQYWSADSRSALQAAANTLASRIVVNAPVTLTYTLIGENTPNGQFLASALTTFSSSSPGYYGTVVQKKILTGVDANGGTADSQITWNFAYPWALGDTVSNNQYDFQSVAMHELVHTFGFQSGIGDPASLDRNWTTFDTFLSTSNGTSVIGGDYVWDAHYTANLTGGGGGLYFDGPNAVLAYGGPVPLYTPGTWIAGSSVSHLDPAHAPAGTTYLMDPTDLYGPSPRVFTPVEVGILTDLGYTVSPGYAIFFLGFGLLRRRCPIGSAQPPINERHCSRLDAR